MDVFDPNIGAGGDTTTGGDTTDNGGATGETEGPGGDTTTGGDTTDNGGATGETGGPGGDAPQSGGEVPNDGTGQNLSGGVQNVVNDACAAWYSTTSGMLRLLGFDLSQGPVVIEPNTPVSAPGVMDLNTRQYIWLRLKVNDVYVGDFYEINCDGQMVGPFFSKVLLVNSSADYLDYSYYNSGSHVFDDPVTIKSLQVELYDPIVGKNVDETYLFRHNSRGRDNEFDLIMQQDITQQ